MSEPLSTENVLGATIVANANDGSAGVVAWDTDITPYRSAASDLARTVGVDA